MKLTRQQLKTDYLEESAQRTLVIGRACSMVVIVVLSAMILQDIYVVGVEETLPWRLFSILCATCFLGWTLLASPRNPRLVIGFYSLMLASVVIQAAALNWLLFHAPIDPAEGWQYGGPGALTVAVFGCFIFATGARRLLPYITGIPVAALLLAFLLEGNLATAEWALLVNPVITTVSVIAVSFPQERIHYNEFAQRKWAQFRKEETELGLMELRRLNETLNHFNTVVSHDLQEPLRTQRGFLQLIERRLGKNADDKVGQYLAQAIAGADRMDTLISGLLAYCRLETRGEPLVRVAVDTVVDHSVASLAAAIEESGLVLHRPERLPEVLGDEQQLEQLFQNLIANAIKYARGNGRPRVTLSAREAGEFWEFSVADNGPGIPKAARKRVFELFSRLHSEREIAGTGVGLAICKRVVERHGGTLWVAPDSPSGADFRFTLRK